jgi:hypothetical protein
MPRKGQWVVYPSSLNQRLLHVVAEKLDQTFANGTTVLYVQGCFAYNTFGKPHRSSYCYYLQPILGQPSEQWLFNSCPGEDQASAD